MLPPKMFNLVLGGPVILGACLPSLVLLNLLPHTFQCSNEPSVGYANRLPNPLYRGCTNNSLDNASTDSAGRLTGTYYDEVEVQRETRAAVNNNRPGNLATPETRQSNSYLRGDLTATSSVTENPQPRGRVQDRVIAHAARDGVLVPDSSAEAHRQFQGPNFPCGAVAFIVSEQQMPSFICQIAQHNKQEETGAAPNTGDTNEPPLGDAAHGEQPAEAEADVRPKKQETATLETNKRDNGTVGNESSQPEGVKSTLSRGPASSSNTQTKEAAPPGLQNSTEGAAQLLNMKLPAADDINPSLDRATIDNHQEDILRHGNPGKVEPSQTSPPTDDQKSYNADTRPPGYYNNERMRQVFNMEGAPESEIETDRIEQEKAIADFHFQNSPSEPIIDDDGGRSEA